MGEDGTLRPHLAVRGLGVPVGLGVVLTVGFRLGLLRGGSVGVDLLLAALGWWLAVGTTTWSAVRDRVRTAWGTVWRPFAAAIAVAIAWVLVEDDTSRDAVVRGAALAGLAGYANWHQISRGPLELLSSRFESPLQHLWMLGVAAQCVALWALAVRASRRRAARHPDRRDPMVVVTLVAAVAAIGIGLAMAAGGAAGQTLLLATPPRSTAFWLGASAGSYASGRAARTLRAVAAGSRWIAVGGLVAVALVAAPDGDLGRLVMVALTPLLAAVLVVASAPEALPVGDEAARPASGSLVRWSCAVAIVVLATPSLALVDALVPHAPAVAVAILGSLLAIVLSAMVVALGASASSSPAAVERRRVLVPPGFVALMALLFSVTGAFHWHGPEPLERHGEHAAASGTGDPI